MNIKDDYSWADAATELNNILAYENATLPDGRSYKKHIEDEKLREELLELAEQQKGRIFPGLPTPPMDSFPDAVSDMLEDVAQAFFVPIEIPVAFFLGLIGSFLGGRVLLKNGSNMLPAFLWPICLADSGTGKTPVMKCIYSEAYNKQHELAESHRLALEAWQQEKQGKQPIRQRLFTSDFSNEAMACALRDNCGNVAVVEDEIAAVFRNLERYGKNGMKSQLLGTYDGKPWDNLRVGSEGNYFIRNAFIPICGGMQPDILPQIFSQEDVASGLFARINFIFAGKASIQRWEDKRAISGQSQMLLTQVTEGLFNIVKAHQPGKPRIVKVAPAADFVFGDFFNRLKMRKEQADSSEKWRYEKSILHCQRLALMFHVLDEILAGKRREEVDRDCMTRATHLAHWLFAHNEAAFVALKGGRKASSPLENAIKTTLAENYPNIARNSYKFPNSWLIPLVKDKLDFPVTDGQVGKACKKLGLSGAWINRQRGWKVSKSFLGACLKNYYDSYPYPATPRKTGNTEKASVVSVVPVVPVVPVASDAADAQNEYGNSELEVRQPPQDGGAAGSQLPWQPGEDEALI